LDAVTTAKLVIHFPEGNLLPAPTIAYLHSAGPLPAAATLTATTFPARDAPYRPTIPPVHPHLHGCWKTVAKRLCSYVKY